MSRRLRDRPQVILTNDRTAPAVFVSVSGLGTTVKATWLNVFLNVWRGSPYNKSATRRRHQGQAHPHNDGFGRTLGTQRALGIFAVNVSGVNVPSFAR